MTNLNQTYSHYYRDCPYAVIDPYRIANLYGLNDPVLFHAFKKILLCGHRGYKNKEQDVKEAIDSLLRWIEMREEEGQLIEPEIGEERVKDIIEGIRNEFEDLNEFLDKLLQVSRDSRESKIVDQLLNFQNANPETGENLQVGATVPAETGQNRKIKGPTGGENGLSNTRVAGGNQPPLKTQISQTDLFEDNDENNAPEIPLKLDVNAKEGQVLQGVMCPKCNSIVCGDLDNNSWCTSCDWDNTVGIPAPEYKRCERCEE